MAYCAPELLKDGKLTKAADVYSFAMMMWEIYTGTPLFRGMNSTQVQFPSFPQKPSRFCAIGAMRALISIRCTEVCICAISIVHQHRSEILFLMSGCLMP